MNVLHQPYPWFFPGATLVMLVVRCDPQALRKAVDSRFELIRPDRAVIWTLDCDGVAGVGGYKELMMNVRARIGGREISTTPYIWVTNDAAMASGREVIGLPKKIASIEQGYFNDQLVASVTRSGVEFARLGMTLDREGDAQDCSTLSERLSSPSANFVNDRLVLGAMSVTVNRVVYGRGFIGVQPSASDPLFELAPVATSATFATVDLTLKAPVSGSPGSA